MPDRRRGCPSHLLLDMTHADLVVRAERWLRNSCKCRVVFTEKVATYCDETPDAIGWRPDGNSILIECKMSVKDWLADQRKAHRQDGKGIGAHRWYLTPKGLLNGREMPATWGLIEVWGKTIRKIHNPILRDTYDGRRLRPELAFMISMYRRFANSLQQASDSAIGHVHEMEKRRRQLAIEENE